MHLWYTISKGSVNKGLPVFVSPMLDMGFCPSWSIVVTEYVKVGSWRITKQNDDLVTRAQHPSGVLLLTVTGRKPVLQIRVFIFKKVAQKHAFLAC